MLEELASIGDIYKNYLSSLSCLHLTWSGVAYTWLEVVFGMLFEPLWSSGQKYGLSKLCQFSKPNNNLETSVGDYFKNFSRTVT